MRSFEKRVLNYNETKEKALRLLEFRSHSENELIKKLKTAGAVDENIEKVMEFLREYNFVNDEDYARRYALDLQNLKKFGKIRIKNELSKKGLSTENIENAIAELPSDDEEELTELVRKKLKGDFDKKNKDKAIRYFLYRGYTFDEVKRCIYNIENE